MDTAGVEAAVVVVGRVVVAWVVVAWVVVAWVVVAVDDEGEIAAVEDVEVAGSAGEVGPLELQADAIRAAARTAVGRTVETLGLPASRIRPKGSNRAHR